MVEAQGGEGEREGMEKGKSRGFLWVEGEGVDDEAFERDGGAEEDGEREGGEGIDAVGGRRGREDEEEMEEEKAWSGLEEVACFPRAAASSTMSDANE